MQALVFIAIFGVISIFGVGFLGNDMKLWIQEFGVGEGDIDSPVLGTELSLLIERVETPNGPDDFITACEFTSLDTDLDQGTKIHCKLFNGPNIETALIIATGFVELNQLVPMNTVIPILITELAFADSNHVDFVENVLAEVQNPSQ